MVVLGVIAFYFESDSLAGFVGEDEVFVDEVLILSIAEVVKFDKLVDRSSWLSWEGAYRNDLESLSRLLYLRRMGDMDRLSARVLLRSK